MACNKQQIKISLVIANALLRQGISNLLTELGYSIRSSCECSQEMLHQLSSEGVPDIVLVDADRDQTANVAAVAWIREHHPLVKILAFALEAEEATLTPLLDHGAHGYLLKTDERSQLRTAFETVLKKGAYFPPLDLWRLNRLCTIQCGLGHHHKGMGGNL